jgi:alkylation response protein AidB-like acyl-CoA dehydrogenase
LCSAFRVGYHTVQMNLRYTTEEEAFRAGVRAWLREHLPRPLDRADRNAMREWHARLHARGFIGTTWPKEYGGGGLSTMEQSILNEELARVDAPPATGGMGVLWVGPAIIRFGTDEQKRRWVPPILSGEEIWCTGYSEPGAGSDLAALRTRATRDGNHYTVSGQKVWTTLAHEADWCFLLARTAAEGPRHAGLTVLLVDMRAPGVEVRPLRQLTGDTEFNEVFFHDAPVPVAHRLGNEGDGWRIVMSALVDERNAMATAIRVDKVFERLAATARAVGKTEDPIWRQRLADLAVRCHIIRCSGLRSLSDDVHGRSSPALSSGLKLSCSELNQRLSATGNALEGLHGILREGSPHVREHGFWGYRMLYDRCLTIAGGTSEVQRNVIAQRVLGLPRG